MASKHSTAIVEAYTDGYRIDNDGHIARHGRRILTTESANGYLMFSYKSATVGWQRVSVSKFAGYQLFGPSALGEGVEVRHLNGNPTDNRPLNLAAGTPSENRLDIERPTRIAIAKIAAAKLRKLTDEQAATLRAEKLLGASLNRLASKYGISKTTVSYIVNGKTYPARDRSATDPVYISPVTGKRHKIRRTK